MRLLPFPPILAALLILFSCAEALAHPGHPHPPEEVDEFDVEAFFSSAVHPFTGLDHLLTMLAVGALACARRLGAAGLAFVGAVGAGFATGLASPAWLLAVSLILAGWFLWKGPPLAKPWIWVAVATIGFLHGGAHASGMTGLAAGMGLCAGTMAGVCLGGAAALGLRALSPVTLRFAGASLALIGLLLTVARLSL